MAKTRASKIRIAELPVVPSIPEEEYQTETVALKTFAGAIYTNVGRLGGKENYWEIAEGHITAVGSTGENVYINYGKTAFDNAETGFILGVNQGTAKFYVGNSTNYFNWTGSSLVISGKLVALSDSEVEWSYIQNVAVENADIVSLNVNKLTAGTITSQAITLAVSGSGDVKIQTGKTDFNNSASGFILGIDDSDSDKAKFYIGSTTVYMNWTGTDLVVAGGTMTGSTIQTAASGARVVLDSSDYVQGFDANKLRVQLITDQLKFFNAEGGDTDYVGIQAVDESILGTTFHSLKFQETWGSGNRDIMFGFHLFPDTDSTWDLGLQSGGDLAWRSVYTDEVVTDKVDLLNANRLDLPAKIESSFGVYATDTTKYLNIDTNKGDVATATNGPDVLTDYHCVRFIFDGSVANSSGHLIAGGASAPGGTPDPSTVGSEFNTGNANTSWIVMAHHGTKGVIETSHAGTPGYTGGNIILSPEGGVVVLEDSDKLQLEKNSADYYSIYADSGSDFCIFTSTGFPNNSTPYGFKFANYILPASDGDLNFGAEGANWAIVYTKYISYSTGEIFDFIANAANVEINRHLVPDEHNHLTCGSAGTRWGDMYTVLFNGADIGFDNDWYLTEAEKVGIKQEGIALVDPDNELRLFIGKDGIYSPNKELKDLNTLKWVKTTLEERCRMDKEWETRERKEDSKPVYALPDPEDAKTGGGKYKKKILWKPNK